MSSLHPGVLFNNAGLNKRYTALSPLKTEQEHSQRRSVTCGGGQILPKPSPVSKVYDVPNSSSRLILLNNKFTKASTKFSFV
ncbi:protein starmaker [Biomphalaria pfeifferi]|uniref:Protein starmaker n=1 Tax=Biomphalaria pfeifferi TaxID=112525 RepID=A0AAD8BQD8_BIOPF|nr:protein starmaker [Biomphalaria pfeifferi]